VVSGLSAAELAIQAGCSEHDVRRLASLGILSAAREPFRASDVQRIRFTTGLEEAGISLELVARGLAEGEMSLAGLDAAFPDPPSFSTRTYGELAREAGVPFDDLRRVTLELGLPHPQADDPVREDDARMLSAFLLGWKPVEREAVVQLARVVGSSLRTLVESYVRIIGPAFARHFETLELPVEERARSVGEIGRRTRELLEAVTAWIVRRHLEHGITQSAVENIENAFQRLGYRPPQPPRVPAIAFLDLTGFTALAEEHGDERAAALAARLGELVQERAAAHGGRPVKWLGDGVMFHFAEPSGAVAAALSIVEGAPTRGLPPARVGVNAGPVVFRDGDYFGRTVNVAARIADYARPGEVLVSEEVQSRAESQFTFEPLGPTALKGIVEAVILYRAGRGPG
jgi:adenylate cyclase